jgi:hypothetical protein
MDGTPAVPSTHTGRAGIPAFTALAHVVVLRFACPVRPFDALLDAAEADVRGCFRQLSRGRCACPAGRPAERSDVPPQWLVLPDGSACGCLEDTRRAKRLVAEGGEMISAHLSCFAWRDLGAAAGLLRGALGRAAALGFPALFVAVPAGDAEALAGALQDIEVVRAPATVYGHGLPSGCAWLLNSSEI